MSDMTNEVAIRLLQTARDKAESAGLREAIDRGIKALEQEPTTKKDLAVEAEDLANYKDANGNSLDDLILEVLQDNFDCGNTYGYKVADAIIELLPTVYPKSDKPSDADLIKANTQLKKQIEMLKLDRECDKPSGKWIYDGHHLRCSNCNDYHAIKDSDWNLIASNYCPNCGSRNVVEEQGENT